MYMYKHLFFTKLVLKYKAKNLHTTKNMKKPKFTSPIETMYVFSNNDTDLIFFLSAWKQFLYEKKIHGKKKCVLSFWIILKK